MSAKRRPWYQWWPQQFSNDEKTRCLSPIAELIYRRTLDVMWEANDGHLPSNCFKIANAVGKGLTDEQFNSAWDEIQSPGFELFKITKNGDFIYSQRLIEQIQRAEKISKSRVKNGRKGGKANTKQNRSKC